MNILKPAELKRIELLRLANALSKHDVTQIVIHRGGEVQHLRAITDRKWQATRSVGSKTLRKRSVAMPKHFQ